MVDERGLCKLVELGFIIFSFICFGIPQLTAFFFFFFKGLVSSAEICLLSGTNGAQPSFPSILN